VHIRLLQARLPSDPVREEERASFAARIGIAPEQIEPYDLLSRSLDLEPVTAGVDLLLVGGSGAFGVTNDTPWMHPFIDLMAQMADTDTPMFASCFGFQALVVGLGGTVRPDPDSAEVGTFALSLTAEGKSDPLFSALPPTFNAQEGHKDRAFDLPSPLVHLAKSARTPFQAARVVGKSIYATQFHPELTHTDNRDRFMRYFDMYQSAFGADEAQAIADAFDASDDSNALLRRFYDSVAAGNQP
jgi:GMP synthase (glutamine-hydrolysing)